MQFEIGGSLFEFCLTLKYSFEIDADAGQCLWKQDAILVLKRAN